MAPSTTERFDQRHRGNRLGFWVFRTALRAFGPSGAYGLLYVVCLHYALFDRDARALASRYIRRRFPTKGRLGRFWAVYKLFISQGRMLVDRAYVVAAGGTLSVDLKNRENLDRAGEDPHRGFIILTSHVGNWQAVMASLGHLGRTVHLVMREEDNRSAEAFLGIQRESGPIRLISPEGFLGGALEIMNSLRAGDIVCVMGDRSYGHACVKVTFLGDPAEFPAGAFHIAALSGCPVLPLFAAKVGPKRYTLDFPRVFFPQYSPGQDRQAQLTAWTQEYVGLIEAFVKDHPDQCFIFHDVWV